MKGRKGKRNMDGEKEKEKEEKKDRGREKEKDGRVRDGWGKKTERKKGIYFLRIYLETFAFFLDHLTPLVTCTYPDFLGCFYSCPFPVLLPKSKPSSHPTSLLARFSRSSVSLASCLSLLTILQEGASASKLSHSRTSKCLQDSLHF